MKITIIGGGNMGQAFARGLAKESEFDLTVSNPSIKKIAYLNELGVNTSNDNQLAINEADLVIIAVKPYAVKNVLEALYFKPDVLLVSIAAGILSEQIAKWAKVDKVVRVMPNTPALIGKGISGFFASKAVRNEEKAVVKDLLKALGEVIEVDDEDLMDAVTAVSASGPAYVFYFLEAMAEAAQELGFSKEVADKLAIETFKGASALAGNSADDFVTLREKVTSKGGTTEAALEVMAAAEIKENFKKAIKRANERGGELRA